MSSSASRDRVVAFARLDRVALRTVLALMVAAVTTVALIGTLAVEGNRDDGLVVEQALRDQQALAASIGADAADWLSWQHSSVAGLAVEPGFDMLTPAEQAARMARLRATYPAIVSFLYYDAAGQVVARSNPGIGPRRLRLTVFEQTRRTGTMPVAVGVWQRAEGRASFVVGAPVEHADGEFGGAILAVGDSSALLDVLRQSLPDQAYHVYLLDQVGQVVAPPGAGLSQRVAARVGGERQGALRVADDDSGGDRLVGFGPIGTLGWHVVVDMPAERSLTAINPVHDLLVSTMLLAILLAAAIGAGLGGWLAVPLRDLARAAERVASGERPEPLPRSRLAEVADLSNALTRLRDQPQPRRAEAAGRESNPTLSALVRASPLAVIVTDAAGTVTAWNPAAERLFGWRADEAIGRSVAEFFEQPLQDIVQTDTGQQRRPIETRRRTRVDELVDVAVWAAPLGRTAERADGSLLIVADIAERKRLDEERARRVREQTAHDEALELQRRLAFLAEASAELNVSLDLEETMETAAHVAVPDLADWCTLDLVDAEDEVLRSAASPSIDARSAAALRELWQRRHAAASGRTPMALTLLSREPVLLREFTAGHLRGTDAPPLDAAELELVANLEPLSAMAVPLLARDQVLGVMTFIAVRGHRIYDATDLALAEALVRRCAVAIENARLYREAQDALRARDTFLSIASHELGSPLARVKAYAEVLLMAQSNQQLDERLLNRSLRSIDRATSRLTTITQDLFDVSRLRVGDLQLRRFRLNLARLLREVTRHYVDEIDERHRLSVRIARGTHPVDVDPDRIEQVLDNLLRNAVKYSPEGGTIFVTLRRADEGVLLVVRDEGIGLPPGAADVIFEPFGRAANAERRNLPGMGLGLYICRSIVERHSGRIWADSPGEHQGMSISVWLPLAV
jgi:PAS domain S-box-containing protein